MAKALKAGTYVGGKFYDVGTKADELDKDVRDQIGDHLWGDYVPQLTEVPENADLWEELAATRQQNSELKAENEGLRTELEQLRSRAGESEAQGDSGSSTPGDKPLDRQNLEELKATAEAEGVELEESDKTKAQIAEKIQAARSGSGS